MGDSGSEGGSVDFEGFDKSSAAECKDTSICLMICYAPSSADGICFCRTRHVRGPVFGTSEV
jgi:hypothetical protein